MGLFVRPGREHGSLFKEDSRRRRTPEERLAQDVEKTQALLEASGGMPPEKPSALETISDLLFRPTYAVAGFTEEASTTGDLRAALARAGREFLGLEGAQKKRFGEVAETIGVPEMGHLSAIAPWLYNETGEGWKFKREDIADVSGRGALGFMFDVVFDPITHLSFGLKPAAGIATKGGKALKYVRLSGAGQKEAAKLAAEELPEATRFVKNILEPVERRYIGQVPLPEPGPSVRSLAEKRVAGQLAKAQQEHGLITQRLAREPLNPAIMTEEVLAKQKIEALTSRLNEISRTVEERARRMPSPGGLRPMSTEEALKAAREIDYYAAEVAEQSALARIGELVEQGQSKWVDDSVVRFMGQPLFKAEHFRPVTAPISRLVRRMEDVPLGTQILAGARVIGRGMDALFNETRRAAGKHPGVREARSLFHADTRIARNNLERSISALIPKALKDAALETPIPWAGGEIKTAGEYLALHLDDPVRFPIDKLTPALGDKVPHIRQLTAEMFVEEARRDLIDPKMYRENYLPHFYQNTDAEMRQLSTEWRRRGGSFNESFGTGPFSEQRTFPTLTDAIEFAKRLKQEGLIDFDLKPNLDIHDTLFKRGLGHVHAIAAETYKIRLYQAIGIDPAKVGEETFKHTFPEIQKLLRERTLTSPAEANKVGELLARALSGKPVSLAGLPEDMKGLYWMGRLTHVTDLRQLQRMMKRHADEIAELDPEIMEQIRSMIGISRRKVLAQFNEPYKRVATSLRKGLKGKPAYKGWYLPESIADDVSKLSEAVINKREVRGMLNAFDFMQDWFKTSATVMFPAFHFRNAYSNVAQNFLALGIKAFDPSLMFRTGAIMAGADGTLRTPLRNYTFQEVRTLFDRFGLHTTGKQLTERIARTNIILDNPVTEVARGVGSGIENHAKLLSFIGHLEDGLTPAQAALRVQKFLFDYDALTPWERDIFRRLIPFFTWTSKNVRLYADMIRRQPGRVANVLKLADTDRGPDREMLPEYLRGDFKVKLRREGKMTYLTGLDLPPTQAIETIFGAGGRNAFIQHISSFNPIMKVFLELGFKKEAFTGRSLEERQQIGDFMGGVIEKLPSWVQRKLEFQKQVRDGETWYNINGLKAYLLFKSYVLSRIFSSVRGLEDDNFKQWAVDNLTGLELREFDLDEAEKRILKNRLREWEKELVRRGVLYPGRPFLPKESLYR